MSTTGTAEAEGDGMNGFIDIHSHILPGVDDGPKGIEGSVAIIRAAYAEGITHMIATPHYRQGQYGRSVEELMEALGQVVEALREADIPVTVSLGNEIYYSGSVLEKLEVERLLTLGGSRYVLIEFSPGEEYRQIKGGLHALLLAGYRPVLAHAERYSCLRNDIRNLRELVRMGFCIQINASSISGGGGLFKQLFVNRLMREDLVHYVATDAHGIESRPPKLDRCIRKIEKKYGEDYVRTLLIDNPGKILEDDL
ncbi:CpsB/CapC family capsule biosynthesis tyrosine phosphatase [Anaerobium acetethylicum]|nr:CpsB/CapC family capsule biosynthesis tyrosine phosphatase [Anaerobium acetethylicum]